jgi:hypothetical protein
MTAPAPVSAQILVDRSSFDTPRVMHFDRYAIFRGKSFYEFHFGFFGHSQELMRGLIAVVSSQLIETLKESFLSYIKQMESLPEIVDLPACRLRAPCDVIPADSIGLARHESSSEIIFHAMSWLAAVELGRSADLKKSLSSICVAMLRCAPELQKRWVIDIYETAEDNA